MRAKPKISPIAVKMFEIMKALPELPRAGVGEDGGYSYFRDEDVTRAVRTAMIAQRVVMETQVISLSTSVHGNIVTVSLMLRFTDIDTGDAREGRFVTSYVEQEIIGSVLPHSSELLGAITSGVKQYLIKTFMITGKDPDGMGAREPAAVEGRATAQHNKNYDALVKTLHMIPSLQALNRFLAGAQKQVDTLPNLMKGPWETEVEGRRQVLINVEDGPDRL